MTSRERVIAALEHREGDKIPFDIGGSAVTGNAGEHRLSSPPGALAGPPGTPVKVVSRTRFSARSSPISWTLSGST